MNNKSSNLDNSITVSVSRRVLPGKEDAYEEWIRGVTKAASEFAGHMGTNVLRPQKDRREYVTIYRFDSYEHAIHWEESAQRKDWLERVSGLVEGEAEQKRVSGLEFWFELPAVPATASPTRYKMAILLMLVVYILVVSISTILAPLLDGYPFYMRLLLIVPVQVLLMTYLVMPWLTRMLKGWMYS